MGADIDCLCMRACSFLVDPILLRFVDKLHSVSHIHSFLFSFSCVHNDLLVPVRSFFLIPSLIVLRRFRTDYAK